MSTLIICYIAKINLFPCLHSLSPLSLFFPTKLPRQQSGSNNKLKVQSLMVAMHQSLVHPRKATKNYLAIGQLFERDNICTFFFTLVAFIICDHFKLSFKCLVNSAIHYVQDRANRSVQHFSSEF